VALRIGLDVRATTVKRSSTDAPAKEAQPKAAPGLRLKTVALPNEHGGWGLSLEPVVLGLLVAPNWTGAGLAVATMAAFLTRHPLKIAAADRRRGRRFARTPAAERFALLYGAGALSGFTLAIWTAPDWEFLLPLALAAPLAAVQLAYDLRGESRSLWPELAGAAALASVAAAMALAGGWSLAAALGLWALLAARVVPTILFVRARLKQLHGKRAAIWPVMVAHLAALGAGAVLASFGVVTWLGPLALAILAGRALHGFGESESVTAKRIGIRELIYGALLVGFVAAGGFAGF
jgi:hypothetical protein